MSRINSISVCFPAVQSIFVNLLNFCRSQLDIGKVKVWRLPVPVTASLYVLWAKSQ